MFETDVLILWLPGRQVPGALDAEFSKRGLQAMPGTVEPEARDFYRNLGGLLLSVVGWQGEWTPAGVVLPRSLHGLLDGLVAAQPDGFEAIVWGLEAHLDQTITARRDLLHGPWPAGVRHVVFP